MFLLPGIALVFLSVVLVYWSYFAESNGKSRWLKILGVCSFALGSLSILYYAVRL